MNALQETLGQRHSDMSNMLTPVDTTKIMDTMNKLKEAVIELTTRNADLVRRNNRLTMELSFMPLEMHDKMMQANKSHSKIYLEQRTDPHYLVPEKPTEFAFERANPDDKGLSLLQRYATYLSVKDLLNEADDITHLMSTVHDATEVDMNDNGNIADDSGNNPTNSAPEPRKVQDISPGEDATT
jgi:hypothetical protein